MTSLPKISIVTPSYNQGAFLEKTIQSVLSQDYPNLEYIVIDGGSTDDSMQIISRYKDKLLYWESEKDNGFGHAINKGFAKATGEVLAWLNSDDLLLPGALLKIGTYFRDHEDVGLVFGDRHVVDEKGTLISLRRYFTYVKGQLRHGKTFPQECTFWRREAFIKAGGYLDETLKFGIDFDLWCRISKHAKIDHISYYLGAYRVQPLSKSSTIASTGLIERSSIIKKHFGRHPSLMEMRLFQMYLGILRRVYRILSKV